LFVYFIASGLKSSINKKSASKVLLFVYDVSRMSEKLCPHHTPRKRGHEKWKCRVLAYPRYSTHLKGLEGNTLTVSFILWLLRVTTARGNKGLIRL